MGTPFRGASKNGVGPLLRVSGVGVLTVLDENKTGSDELDDALSMEGLDEVDVEGRLYAEGGDIPSSV